LPDNKLIHRLVQTQEWLHLLDGALYPDHAVFLGDRISVVSGSNRAALVDILNTPPFCAAVIGESIILGEKCSKGAEAMLECLALLAPHLPERECLHFLTPKEITEISSWDAEKARLQITPSL
jgi:rhamnose utilization protein RhaD (predicted bifunctional aldolase and dehydrogenase)